MQLPATPVTRQTFTIPNEERTMLITEENGFYFYDRPPIAFENTSQQPEIQLSAKNQLLIHYNSIEKITKAESGSGYSIYFQMPAQSNNWYSFHLFDVADRNRFEDFLQYELTMNKQIERMAPNAAIRGGYFFVVLTALLIALNLYALESGSAIRAMAGLTSVMVLAIMLYRYKKPPLHTVFYPATVSVQNSTGTE